MVEAVHHNREIETSYRKIDVLDRPLNETLKEMEELIAKIREYSHLAATLSNQAGEIPSTPKESRKQKMELMRQARDANRQCRALIEELKQQQAA